MDGGDGQQVVGVARDAAAHGLVVAVPVASAELPGEDEVQAAAYGVAGRLAEHLLRPVVPFEDPAFGVGDDDGVDAVRHQADG